MKKIVLFLMTVLGMASAKADDGASVLSANREQKVKEALETLIEEGMISESVNQCINIDQSLLDELRGAGIVIPSSDVKPQSICVVPK